MRLRVALAGLVLGSASVLVGGCVATLSYDDYGDQKAGASSDAGGDAHVCVPKTCADQAANCGDVPDDCGKILNCGQCGTDETCGGGGANKCGSGACVPKTCNELGALCGAASDTCGKTLDCGGCTNPKVCIENKCGCESTITCADVGAECGAIDDGCGGTTDCGNCQDGFKCSTTSSGSGIDGKGHCVCNVDPCANYPYPCGYATDCNASSVLCGCANGNQCQIMQPGNTGTCG